MLWRMNWWLGYKSRGRYRAVMTGPGGQVGTALAVATGRLPEDAIERIFAAGDRRLVPMAAPAHGLCLERVLYDDY